jgi:hypothetical protein
MLALAPIAAVVKPPLPTAEVMPAAISESQDFYSAAIHLKTFNGPGFIDEQFLKLYETEVHETYKRIGYKLRYWVRPDPPGEE